MRLFKKNNMIKDINNIRKDLVLIQAHRIKIIKAEKVVILLIYLILKYKNLNKVLNNK